MSMLRSVKTIKKLVVVVSNIEKEAIVTRKKTGWFDKETFLNRILNNIHRMRLLSGVPQEIKKDCVAQAFAVYLNVQGMSDKNEIRDERRVPVNMVLSATVNNFSEGVDNPSPMIYAHGLGYAVVNWRFIYVQKEKQYNPFWKPGSGKRDKHGRLLDLMDSDYWGTKK